MDPSSSSSSSSLKKDQFQQTTTLLISIQLIIISLFIFPLDCSKNQIRYTSTCQSFPTSKLGFLVRYAHLDTFFLVLHLHNFSLLTYSKRDNQIENWDSRSLFNLCLQFSLNFEFSMNQNLKISSSKTSDPSSVPSSTAKASSALNTSISSSSTTKSSPPRQLYHLS